MKFTIEIDCTPDEARAFFGMPSMEAFNAKMMEHVQARMMEHLKLMDPEALAKMWMPGTQAWQQMTEAFTKPFGDPNKK